MKQRQMFVMKLLLLVLVPIILSGGNSYAEETENIVEEASNSIDIIPLVFSQTVDPCSLVSFKVRVENTGDFEEEMAFAVKQIPTVEILPAETSLQPREKKEVTIRFIPDDCSFSGKVPLIFLAKTESGIRAEIDLFLTINSADKVVIAEKIKKIVTNYSIATVEIPVKNQGDRDGTYALSLDAPSWIKLKESTLQIKSGTESKAILILTPEESIAEDKYPAILTVTVDGTERKYTKDLTIVLSDNQFFGRIKMRITSLFAKVFSKNTAQVVGQGVGILAGFIVLAFLLKQSTQYYQRNREEGDVSKESDDKSVRKSVLQEVRQKFVLIPKHTVLTPRLIKAAWLVKGGIIGVVGIIAVIGYFFKQLAMLYLDYVVLGLLILGVGFVVRACVCRWLISKCWKFVLANEYIEWETGVRKGIVRISMKLNDAVENLRIVIKKGKVSIPANGIVYGYWSVFANVDSSACKDVKIVWKIKKSWLRKNDGSEKEIRVVCWNNDRWKTVESEILGSDDTWLYLEGRAETIGTFALIIRQKEKIVPADERIVVSDDKKDKKEQKSHKTMWTILAVLLVVVVGGLSWYVLEAGRTVLPANEKGIPSQVWQQDTTHVLDLSSFFKDPDGEQLSLSAKSVENIKITFDNAVATFVPDASWSGERTTVFTATDSEGATASSNEIKLVVEKSRLPKVVQDNFSQIISGILFVVIVVILIVFREKIIRFLDEEKDD